MPQQDLHLTGTAPWRALLTHAQFAAGVQLPLAVEEHVVSVLFRYIGAEITPADVDHGVLDRIDRLVGAEITEPAVVGDQCLLFAGLFPDQAIRAGLPVTYLVEVGRNAWREHASRHDSALHAVLADRFVAAMDALQTLRELQGGAPCIDAFNAFALWQELGSQHAWRVLRTLTGGLPGAAPGVQRVH